MSHRHFDYTGGLAPLLVGLVSVPEAFLTVYAPPTTLGALRELLGVTIPGVEGWLEKHLGWGELIPGKPTRVGDAEVTPFEVDHGLECVDFRVAQGGSAMVFSADTRPSPNVVEYASGAELLVHEAYGLEENPGRAHAFGHPPRRRWAGSPSTSGFEPRARAPSPRALRRPRKARG